MATMRASASASLMIGLGERLRVAGRHGLRRADQRVEHGGVVEVLLVVVLGRRVAAALLGEDVDDDRALGRQLDGVAQRLLERRDVVAVDRSDVAHAERLEERRRLQDLAHRRLDRVDGLLGRRADDGHVAQQLLEAALAAHVRRVEADLGEHLRQPVADAADQARRARGRAGGGGVGREVGDRRRVAAAVVVEHDDHAALAVAEVVERLVGHAAGHRAVADHGDDVAVRVAPGVAGDGEAVGVGEDRRGVAVLDVVVAALLARRVAGQAAAWRSSANPARRPVTSLWT